MPAAGPPESKTAAQASRMNRRAVLRSALALPAVLAAPAAFAAPPEPRRYFARVLMSGHSLTDSILPPLQIMVSAVGGAEARRGVIDRSTVPGSPMEWRWEKRHEIPPDARLDIGNYDVLVNTERGSLVATMPYHDTLGYALKWFEHAWKNGNGGKGAESILYATWVSIDSGPEYAKTSQDPEAHLTFRERLGPEMARWQEIADYVNQNRSAGSPAMTVIPGPLIMKAVLDDIEAGKAPGLSAISDLFTDDIHLSDIGSYLIAMAHFAVIYRRDPRILPANSGLVEGPKPETIVWMKDLVARVLRDYPGAGLEGLF